MLTKNHEKLTSEVKAHVAADAVWADSIVGRMS